MFENIIHRFDKLRYGWDPGKQANESLVFFPDLNHWLGEVNKDRFAEMVERMKVKLVILKYCDATRDTGKIFYDSKADAFYRVCRDLGLPVGGYAWLQASVDPTVFWKGYKSFEGDHPVQVPHVLDFEEKKMNSATDMLWRARTWFDHANADWGSNVLCYTGLGYIDFIIGKLLAEGKSLNSISWMRRQPLWLAMYTRYWPETFVKRSMRYRIRDGLPLYPWTDFAAWQYSGEADKVYWYDEDGLDAREWGFDSRGLDMNWMRRTWYAQNVKSGLPQPEPPDPLGPPPVSGVGDPNVDLARKYIDTIVLTAQKAAEALKEEAPNAND